MTVSPGNRHRLPADLPGTLHDRVHRDTGRARAARTVRWLNAACSRDPEPTGTEKELPLHVAERQIREAWGQAKRATWALAGWLWLVRARKVWRERCHSFSAWAESEHCAPSKGTVSKLLAAYERVDKLPPDLRERYLEDAEPLQVYQAKDLVQRDPERALELIRQGASRLYERAAEEADSHRETEYRTIVLRVSLPVYKLWQQCLNRAAFEAHKRQPSNDDLLKYIANEIIQAPIDSEDKWAGHELEIASRRMACEECGSQDARELEFHHVTPRSHGGGDEPGNLAVLCRACHAEIQSRWKEWASQRAIA